MKCNKIIGAFCLFILNDIHVLTLVCTIKALGFWYFIHLLDFLIPFEKLSMSPGTFHNNILYLPYFMGHACKIK